MDVRIWDCESKTCTHKLASRHRREISAVSMAVSAVRRLLESVLGSSHKKFIEPLAAIDLVISSGFAGQHGRFCRQGWAGLRLELCYG